MELVQIIIGSGIIGCLIKLNSTLAEVKTAVRYHGTVSADHEDRIRRLEGK